MKVIAHRGASAYLPEHTFESKAMAHAMGAHFLEQDLVATRDAELVVLHDIHLDRVSDVASRFPGRAREDGRFYAIDFDLAEIRTLRVNERVNPDGSAVYPDRFPVDLKCQPAFRLHTFDEEIAFIAGMNTSTGSAVGIYPEIKRPAWHREQGVDITLLTLDSLQRAGFATREDNVFLQCFDAEELQRIRHGLGSDLPLIQLIGDNSWSEGPTDFAQLVTRDGLRRAAETVDGFGPWIPQLYRLDAAGRPHSSGLAESMRALDKEIHPYTARIDDLPDGFETFMQLLQFLAQTLDVEAVFSDFPDEAVLAAMAWD